ncbi:MAG: methionine--tRNA ligase [Acidimicrobiia bacterium]|nr:methionine--tRNA ligase [Acidimicrobiia bacterium]MDH3471241.1 methionine--tRNA ligase [Acidimicrobiia bacterium]
MASRNILVAVAWPYASGSLHLGHIAGAYLPADIFAKYHRLAGNKVLMVSGSDVHGTPITVRADEQGVTPQEIVDRFHPEFLEYWRALSISFDLFTTTGTDNHRAVAQDMFLRLRENGFMYRHTTEQAYDETAGRFLPDRYVEGTCPHCGYGEARGDQCDNCGRTLDAVDLIDPKSKLTGTKPVQRETEHYFFKLSAFQEPLTEWLKTRQGWRKAVQNWAVGFVEEGLHDRAFTRDMDWGIPLPVDDLGPGKVIYVWWEAVMGYLSAAKEWAQIQGTPDAWKDWWENPEAETYYFIGKDNIPFHAVYWPALLMGYEGLNLPTNVPANQYVTFGGEKASKSRSVGDAVLGYLESYQPDGIRYALAASMPEQDDTDLTEGEIVRRINDELVANWGNLVNRVLSMTKQYFSGVTPKAELADKDRKVLDDMTAAIVECGEHIEAVRLKAGLNTALAAAQQVNAYLSEAEPWKTAKREEELTAATLYTAVNAIAAINLMMAPYLPFGADKVWLALGVEPSGWQAPEVEAGVKLGDPGPIFQKADLLR